MTVFDEIRELVCSPAEAWPTYSDDEIMAAAAVLRSGKVNQWTGSAVSEFEAACEQHFGGRHGIALANGSVALDLILRVWDIGPGDEVIVTPRTFMASAACVRLAGATPVFVDIDQASGNITAATIAAALTPRTRAIIAVHLGGWPCDMPAIMRLAEAHGIRVIEDCAQAHGAAIAGRPVGGFGHASAFSFCQDKIISTGGEGGYVRFANESEFEHAWSFKDHGKNRAKALDRNPPSGFRWLHDTIGTNWRLTGPQAAIGVRQLQKLPAWVEARNRNAAIWRDGLSGLAQIEIPEPPADVLNAYYRLYLYLRDDDVETRDRILASARDRGLRLFSGSCSEVYREHAFDDLPRPDLPIARRLGRTSLAVETHPTLHPEALVARAAALREIIGTLA